MSAEPRRLTEPMLECYLVGSLDEEARARVQAVLAESEADRARLEELRAESAAFLLQFPPGPLVERFEASRRAWWRQPLVLFVPVLASLVLLVLVLLDDRNKVEARAQRQLAEVNAAMARAQQQAAEANAVAANAQQQLAEVNAAMARVRQQLAEATAAAASAQQQLIKANAVTARTQQQAAEANAAAARAQQQIAEANPVAARTQQQLAEANMAAAKAQQQLADANAAVARVQHERQEERASRAVQERIALARADLPWHASDSDGDGTRDSQDMCPTTPGDPLRMGCPQSDTDRDGIEDALDTCTTEPGATAYQGCPLRDRDRDGIEDALDSCLEEPGPSESRGCPLKDRDKDGIENDQDVCPDEPGPPERQGCPEEDSDKDGVPNRVDVCPQHPGVGANLGCPEHEFPLVAIAPRAIDLHAKVYFEASQANIQQRSFAVLDWVARVMREHPEIPRVEVAAHTDDKGFADQLRLLSQQRAEKVRRYLIDKGVAPERLVARGYGPDRPIDSNAISIGRENNRRVEFKIIRDTPAESAAPR